MSNIGFVKSVYAAFAVGEIEKILGMMHPAIQWTETAGSKYGGVFNSPQAVLQNVFAKIAEDFETFEIDVDRLIDGGDVVVMQGHYIGKGKATGHDLRVAVAHVLEVKDGTLVRFDQYVDSATMNAVIGG
jgi:ketosteroid isomerase-like protein